MLKHLTALALATAISTPALADTFNWQGPYIGAHAGYTWGEADHAQTNGGMPYGPYTYDVDGAFGGLTLGYNLHLQSVLVGIEAEGGYMDLSGEGRIPSSTPPNYQALDVDGGLYALIAARIGITIDRTLIYGKGGYAYVDGDAGQETTKPGFVTHRSDAFQGFVYGAGIEQAFSDRLSIKIEYLRFDFDTVDGDQTSVSDPPIGFVYENKTDVTVDTVKLGVNLRF